MQYQPQETEFRGRRIAALGAISVAQCRKVALLCSERCPGNVILKAYDFARLVRGSEIVIVSGFQSPIEKDCLNILLRGSQRVIICLARKLSSSHLSREWQEAINTGRMLLLSPFSDRQKRVTVELATQRNRFAAEVSEEVLMLYAAPSSKTEALGLELLSTGKRVYTFQSGNDSKLISYGAITVLPELFVSSLRGSWEGTLDAAHHKY
jgi:predicted Rossmann fold nucleotide-binding protein DprA/Smf involved in DNA uptake